MPDKNYNRHFPSREYLKNVIWARDFHATRKTFTGKRSFAALPTLRFLCQMHAAKTLLDYGCLDGGCVVETEDGLQTMQQIVESKYTGLVKSLDGCSFTWQRVTNHWARPNRHGKPWVRIDTIISNKRIVCTADHPCAIVRDPLRPEIEYVPAGETQSLFVVRQPGYLENPLLNADQISVMVGCALGDGGVRKDGLFYVTHGAKQLPYLAAVQALVGGRIVEHNSPVRVIVGRTTDASLGYRLLSPINSQTRELRRLLYQKGKKTVRNILPYVNELALAFWYMDDGEIRQNRSGYFYNGQWRQRQNNQQWLLLNTQSFAHADHKLLCRWFRVRWGLSPAIYQHRRNGKLYRCLAFKGDDSNRFWDLVAPYMHQSMHYKLPERLHDAVPYEFARLPLDFAATKVRQVVPVAAKDRLLYDIEVAETHNFVADGSVVHNCGKGEHYEARDITIKRLGVIPSLKDAVNGAEIYPYDPAWPPYAKPPREEQKFDGSFTVDVLEYIPGDDLSWVMSEICHWAEKFVLINYSCSGTTKPAGDDAPTTHYWHPEGFMSLLLRCAATQPQLDLVCRLQTEKKEQWKIYRRLPHETDWLFIDDSQLWPADAAKE